MQIEKIILYSHTGKIRIINLKIGNLNIITGKSKSGKSSVGDIIEYCLGGSRCTIADGVVRDNVSWYGLLLNFGDEHLFVARKNPDAGAQTTTLCYYEEGMHINIPPYERLISNTNVSGIEEILNKKIHISENLHIPPEGQSRNAISANVRHSLFYCFQGQDEIAARNILFHRQSEEYIAQTIKDTMPYFLGAVDEHALELEAELKEKKRELRVLKRKKSSEEVVLGENDGKAVSLLSEAIAVGLIQEGTVDVFDSKAIVDALTNVHLGESVYPVIERERLAILQDKLKEEEEKREIIDAELKAARSYLSEFSGFGSEAEHQKNRLESIGLFEKLDFEPNKCPFCSGDLLNPLPSIDMMKSAIMQLDESIGSISREKPKLQKHINELVAKQIAARNTILDLKSEIDGILEQEKEARELKDINIRKGKVLGRISLWLESHDFIADSKDIDEQIEKLEKEIEDIQELLSIDTIEERITSCLSKIQMDMTNWAADSLNLEHGRYPYRYDPKNVTVIVDKERPVPLQQMGSGSNWVGVHLITYVAFQKLFMENNRPVPRFIFLDQPSQVYFPSGDGNDKDIDMEEVAKLYKFLNDQVEALNHGIQIIVVDHAQLQEDAFKNNLIENWWSDENNLVPLDWYND